MRQNIAGKSAGYDDAWKLRPQPVAKGCERRIGFAERTIHEIPGLPLGNGNRKWRNQPAHRDVVFHIGTQPDGNADAVQRGLQGHPVIGKAWSKRFTAQFHTGGQP